jgi:large subunit ribosomal protein L28
MAFRKVIEGSIDGPTVRWTHYHKQSLGAVKRSEESWSKAMAHVCALTGKKVQYGHNVSHSKRATNRRFEPNIQKVRLLSEALGQRVPLSIAARTLRTVQKKGGLDGFLLATDDTKLQAGALRLKNKIRRKLSGR